MNWTRVVISAVVAGMAGSCTATLPSVILKDDSDLFSANAQAKRNADACGGHLNSLRANARNMSWLRVGLTIAAGSTTAVSSYFAATQADDDPDKAKTSAQIALVGGLIAVFTQAVPDPSQALDRHRDASSSWQEARLRVYKGDDPGTQQVLSLLDQCRNNKPFTPVPEGARAPIADCSEWDSLRDTFRGLKANQDTDDRPMKLSLLNDGLLGEIDEVGDCDFRFRKWASKDAMSAGEILTIRWASVQSYVDCGGTEKQNNRCD